MKILHISAECYPIAKVGGLADVVGSLPKYQNKNGFEAQVIMPFYNNKFVQKNEFLTIYENELTLGQKRYNYKIKKLKLNELGFELFLVDISELLFTDFVYSKDDSIRFLTFQIVVLDWVLTLFKKPSIVHCHDHHTGLIPFMMTQCYGYDKLKMIPTVLTIHNAQYQGWFSHDKVHLLPSFNPKNIGLLDWDGNVNPLAAAIKCAWRVTTVSSSYMDELKVSANGLENLLKHEAKKCIGVLNGIDTEVWNTEWDSYLIKAYKLTSIQSGKNVHKRYLCKQFELNFNKPLFIFIGRLVGEKGAELLPEVFRLAIEKNNCSILLLGSGNVNIENDLKSIQNNNQKIFNYYIGYNEKLAHLMYAGADFLLMPSRVEPCGLNQLYALRYGTIPIVRSIGGLKDTVTDISKKNGVGFTHKNVDVKEIVKAIERAVILYQNKLEFKKIRKRGMLKNHSWEVSATSYINIYKSLKA